MNRALKSRDLWFLFWVVALVALPVAAQPAEPLDYDGDGYSNDAEAGAGSHPLAVSSTPDTDDDGDGVTNSNEDYGSGVDGLCTGAFGIVQAPVCKGYDYPGGQRAWRNADCLGYAEDPSGAVQQLVVCLDSQDRVWIWDGICSPRVLGGYGFCKGDVPGTDDGVGSSNYDASEELYDLAASCTQALQPAKAACLVYNGYGWRRVTDPVSVFPVTLPAIYEPGAASTDGKCVYGAIATGMDRDGDGVPRFCLNSVEYTVHADRKITAERDGDPVWFGDPDDSDPNTPIPPVPTYLCADQAGASQDVPTGATRSVDNDNDAVPVVEYQTQTWTLTADCFMMPGMATQWVSTGLPDTADDDPNVPNPGPPEEPCLAVNNTSQWVPDGRTDYQDLDGDEVPRVWIGETQYTTHADCTTTAGAQRWTDTGGPDPADNDDQNPVPTINLNMGARKLNPNNMFVSASQAQCSGDKVAFTLALTSNVQDLALGLWIVDKDGDVVSHKPKADLVKPDAASKLYLHAEQFNPGTYTVIGYLDTGAIPLQPDDRWYGATAFNVPVWGCEGFTPSDRGAIAADFQQALAEHNAASTDHGEHRQDSLEIMGMNFENLGFDGFLFFLFWIAVLLFTLYNHWLFAASFSIPGLFNTILPDWLPGSFTTWFVFVLLGGLLEYWTFQRRSRGELRQ